jgi:hypothetical protein
MFYEMFSLHVFEELSLEVYPSIYMHPVFMC